MCRCCLVLQPNRLSPSKLQVKHNFGWHLSQAEEKGKESVAKIYLIRHAESIANTKGIYQGQTYDTTLSPLGEKQSEAIGNRLADIRFDAIYASPLTRTRATALSIKKHQKSPVDIRIDTHLLETNHGLWEGETKQYIVARWSDLWKQWQEKPGSVQFPSGENFIETADRANRWLQVIAKKTGTFAVVTHGNIIQCLLVTVSGLALDDIWKFAIQPTALTILEAHSPIHVVVMNDTSHLNNLKSHLSIHAI